MASSGSTLFVDVYEPPEIKEKLVDITAGVIDLTGDNLGGDYMWLSDNGKTWAVERKTVQDFIDSFYSGRLTKQLRQITENYDYQVLMIEGLMTQTDQGNLLVPQRGRGIRQFDFKWSLAWDILTEAQLTGVVFRNTTNKLSSADTIRHLYHWSSRSDPVLLNRMRKGGMEYGTKENIRVQFLTGLPQIGPEVA